MSMSTRVTGFIKPDERFIKMKEIFDACRESGVTVPKEVWDFFKDEIPSDAGIEVDISKYITAVTRDMTQGYEVDVETLTRDMPQVKTIHFTNNY